MAALQSQTPCPDCDCSDSPLSVTGNILGILTFAVAVYASLLYYYRGFRASKLEQSDMFYKVLLAKEELAKIRSEIQDLEILDDLKIAWQQFDTTLISTENDIEEVYRLLTGQRFEISVSNTLMHFVKLSSLRNRAAYLLEREKFVEAMGKMEASVRHSREVASDVRGRIPTETDGRVLNMVSVLEEIRVQNNGLRLVMDDVLRRVSALESGSGERTTEPRVGKEE